jgi:dephospho-CoA kinase
VLLIGLTGGIGSGKSTVAELFARLGAGVVDTDLLARELTQRGTATLAQIAAQFGAGILNADGSLDRVRLRERIFADPAERRRLEALLHPPIRELMLERAAALQGPYVILVIPLLFETSQQTLVNRVLVVDCPEPVQIRRVQGRSGLSDATIAQIMRSQIPRAERLARADDIIDNQGIPDALPPQVRRLHRDYLALAVSDSTGRP